MPSTPLVAQGFTSLRGPMNISYRRRESAPYSRTMSSGLTTLPRDLDIFWPSSPRMRPWLTSFWKGSLVVR